MITLHQYHMSPFNDKIQRMLHFKNIPYTERFWLLAERNKVKAINPTGKLPALEHEGKLVCDSTDIAHYIEQQFPENPLIPTEPLLRGMVHVLEDWADESLYFYEMTWRFATPGNAQKNIPRLVANEKPFLRWLLPKVAPRGLAKILDNQGLGRKSVAQLETDTRRHVQAVDDLLSDSEFLVGNRLTLADLSVRIMLESFLDAVEAEVIVLSYPRVVAWMKRVADMTEARA
jgi:glutathione S-transferase